MERVIKDGSIWIFDDGALTAIVKIPEGKTVEETIEMLEQVMEEGFYGRD